MGVGVLATETHTIPAVTPQAIIFHLWLNQENCQHQHTANQRRGYRVKAGKKAECFWGSAWLFANPAGCMEEAFSVVSSTQKSTAIREVAVSTLEFYQGYSRSKLLSISSMFHQYNTTSMYQKLKNLHNKLTYIRKLHL